MSELNFREIYSLFDELCTSLCGAENNKALKCISQYISAHPNTLSRSLPYDESTLKNKISSQLNSSKSAGSLGQFFTSYEKLSSCMEPQLLNSVLTFLLCSADAANNKNNNLAKASRTTSLHLSTGLGPSNFFNDGILSSNAISNFGLKTLSLSASSSNIDAKMLPFNRVPRSTSTSNIQPSLSQQDSQRTNGIMNTSSTDSVEELVQNVIYSFTGTEGKYFKKDIIVGGLKLDPKVRLQNVKHAAIMARLAETAYYHDQVQSFTDSSSGRSPIGLLGQGLVTAYKQELTSFYGMVAMLQEQLNRNQRQNSMNSIKPEEKLTLLKLEVWIREPNVRLQWLSTISEACQEKKGGALASQVYRFRRNGDTAIKTLVHELLVAVSAPLQYMLSKWLLEGEINDPYSEFFIEILPDVSTDRLWSDKYRVRESMLPNFISKEFAHQILVTGKSINFLKEICEEQAMIKGQKELKEYFEKNVDDIFADVPDTKLHFMINDVYLNTSKKVLDIVMGPHKLLEHLQAMRKYLLLGQGDFIGLLMQNLKPELDRPARDLYSYELSSILESTLRSTNSHQYDDSEILNHLDVRLMTHFRGDTGWDIFTLQYTVRGPLSTMLEPSMSKYLQLFKHLWRIKHLEFVLSSKIWKDQMCNAKCLRSMQTELNPVMYRLYLHTSEMIHFIHQIQYYILFEVVECSWTKMLDKVNRATALDDILEAHNEFLHNVKIGAFLEDDGIIHSSLEAVFNASIKLESWQDSFYDCCLTELKARRHYEDVMKKSAATGTYGETTESRLERDQDQKIFELAVVEFKKSLEKIGTDYEYAVRQFLLLLATHNDNDMLLFSIRLDFNEYYKNRYKRLEEPLTMKHMRMTMNSIHNQNKSMISSTGSVNCGPSRRT